MGDEGGRSRGRGAGLGVRGLRSAALDAPAASKLPSLALFALSQVGIRLTYRAVGSVIGVGELVGTCCTAAGLLASPYTNFAASDVPLSAPAFTLAAGNGISVFQARFFWEGGSV